VSYVEDFTGKPGSIITSAPGSIPCWVDSPAAWNTVFMAGHRLPGVARVSGKAFEVRADKKKAAGINGERLTRLGRDPAEPEFVFKIWTSKQLKQFVDLVKIFLPKGSAQLGPPVDVVHPALALYNIKSVQVMVAGFPEEKGADIYEIKLKCREFFRGSGKPTTPVASTGGIMKYDGKTGADAAQKTLKERTAPDHTNAGPPRHGATGSY
jgi:hypothetical protein